MNFHCLGKTLDYQKNEDINYDFHQASERRRQSHIIKNDEFSFRPTLLQKMVILTTWLSKQNFLFLFQRNAVIELVLPNTN